MAIEPDGAAKTFMHTQNLPWLEADEDRLRAVSAPLRSFRDATAAARAEARRPVGQLVESGRGEVPKALAAHWDTVSSLFDRVLAATDAITPGCERTVAEIEAGKLTLLAQVAALMKEEAEATLMAPGTGGASLATFAGTVAATRTVMADQLARALTGIRQDLGRVLQDPNVSGLSTVRTDLPGGAAGGMAGGATGAVGGMAGAAGGAAGALEAGAAVAGAGGGMYGGATGGMSGRAFGEPDTGTLVDHDESKRAASRLDEVAIALRADALPPLTTLHAELTALGGGEHGALAAGALKTVADHLTDAVTALADHLSGTLRSAVLASSATQGETDDDTRRAISGDPRP
ncbi:hypothetical protein ACIQRS_08860 [Streptomyces termitum]|uniref:Uncharacterized protein n=1 Tax=Streptomyces termitum TaxID=67368 RepID=A0A918W278_9ACTN|nr:hypothetical protein [Streptomyces termitum]GHA64007.1 hypothetical protein GCM10010305_01840 [Streptomyces termitum]